MTHRLYRVLAVLTLLSIVAAASALQAGPRDLVVVRPGGPAPSEEADLQVNRLIREIASRAGWSIEEVRARYFNRADDALNQIRSEKPGFILCTPGFFLANRSDLGLVPLNQILLEGRDSHRYHVVARNGGPSSLAELKGKTMLGAVLAEPDFVERVVLEGAFDFGGNLDVGYSRALSALRRLVGGEVDAVILDDVEHEGMASLPFATDVATIFTSRPIPNTGIFLVRGTARQADGKALLEATRDFCREGEAAAICETYGISGFKEAPEGVFDGIIRQYDGKHAVP